QHFQASFSLLMRLYEFAAQIIRIGFRHRLRVEVFARAVFIIAENALAISPKERMTRFFQHIGPEITSDFN
ncbi:MAG: hypothetical protein OXB98_13730, partial [Bryobacterales bacterium]|nr:hypothetical protein [Bryobacterales bacterium]